MPLDSAIAGKEWRENIVWNDQLSEAFTKAQTGLSGCQSIVLPKRQDQLWIVTDGSVIRQRTAGTLYTVRNNRRRIAGLFSAKLRDRQSFWLLSRERSR